MATPTIFKKLSRNIIARNIVSWIGMFYIRLVETTSTWAYEYAGPEEHRGRDRPFIACFWHGRLMMMGSNWPRRHPFYMLISKHPDGKLVSQIIQRLGFKTLEGSTRKGGGDAMRSMLRILKGGNSVGITPDGPQGPRMRVGIGTIALARISGRPILPTTFSTTRRKVLNTWDKFILAGMFGKGVFLWGTPIWVPKEASEVEMENLRQKLEDCLNNLTLEADKLCGHPAINPAPPGLGKGVTHANQRDNT